MVTNAEKSEIFFKMLDNYKKTIDDYEQNPENKEKPR